MIMRNVICHCLFSGTIETMQWKDTGRDYASVKTCGCPRNKFALCNSRKEPESLEHILLNHAESAYTLQPSASAAHATQYFNSILPYNIW